MTMHSGNGPDFDDLLEEELHRRVGSLSGPSSQVSASAYHAAFLQGEAKTFSSSITALASSKAAVALAVAVLAIGGASAGAAAATGSLNPVVWGKTVSSAVATCKDQLKNGARGIGQCVSDVAKQKGAEERAAHSQGNPVQDHPTGAPTSHPTGPPTSHPTGPPTPHPTGPPTPHPHGGPTPHPHGPPGHG